MHSEQTLSAREEVLFRHAPFVLVTTLLVSGALVAVSWRQLPPSLLLGWWLAIAIPALFRAALLIGYWRRAPTSTIPWRQLMTLATGLSGVAWGSTAFLFFLPHAPTTLIFLTITVAGLTAGSTSSLAAHLPAQIAFAVPAMLPLALRYLWEGDELSVIGLFCLLFLFNVIAFAREVSRTLGESIQLRFEKERLVARLEQEKAAAESARERAEEANLAKSKFLAAASHDLRQPLHALNLFIEVLRHERDADRSAEILAQLGDSAQALDELLNELLDISRLEAGLFTPKLSPVDVQALFDTLVREFRPVAEEKGIELGFAHTRVHVLSDPHMLTRIMRNIITNAIRYTERGAILVGCRRRGARVALAVYDTGPGIPEEHHRTIFREFHQLGNPERDRRKGLGLGLAIVERLARLLDHPISLTSRLGSGSAFFVEVPVTDPAPVPGDEAESGQVAPLNITVLLIEDEPAVLLAMTEVLQRWGSRVLSAGSADEALERLAETETSPDVIISDYRLRDGRTGGEAIAAVRLGLVAPVPAIIITGDTAPERLRDASAVGALLLHKPIQPRHLRAALASLAGTSSKQPPPPRSGVELANVLERESG